MSQMPFIDPLSMLEQHQFEDVSHEMKSPVWRHFSRSKAKTHGRCNYCSAIIRTLGGTTTAMMVHLRTKHYMSSVNVADRADPNFQIWKNVYFFRCYKFKDLLENSMSLKMLVIWKVQFGYTFCVAGKKLTPSANTAEL